MLDILAVDPTCKESECLGAVFWHGNLFTDRLREIAIVQSSVEEFGILACKDTVDMKYSGRRADRDRNGALRKCAVSSLALTTKFCSIVHLHDDVVLT